MVVGRVCPQRAAGGFDAQPARWGQTRPTLALVVATPRATRSPILGRPRSSPVLRFKTRDDRPVIRGDSPVGQRQNRGQVRLPFPDHAVAEEDEILRQRLVEAVARITFPKPAPIPPPSAPAIPPSLMRAK